MSGVEKYTDPNFSSAGFLSQAKGPLADFYHRIAAPGHGWRSSLAQPLEDSPESPTPPPESAATGDMPASAPYKGWAEHILSDWQAISRRAIAKFDLDDDQRKLAGEAYSRRADQLKYYLWEQWPNVVDYRHEVWRLERMQADSAAGNLPFLDSRIAEKQAKTTGMVRPWLAAVDRFEQGYLDDLDAILTKDQRARGDVKSLPGGSLKTIDQVVTYLTLGVGACLLLGVFTRIGALAGGVFLLGVISTQPPWVAGAEPVYYQVVETAAIFTLATLPVGRWAGLDFFIYALWSRCCGGAKSA